MRILLLSAHPAVSLSDSQGYAIRMSELASGLRDLGHEVFPLIAGDQRSRVTAQRIYKRGVKRLIPRRIAQMLRELSFLLMDRQFYAECKAEVERIAPDVILERFSFFNRTGMWLAERYDLPLVLDDISPSWEEEVYFRRTLKQLARYIQGQVFARADALVAVSAVIKQYLVDLGIPLHKITVIHNGANCERFSPNVDGVEIRECFDLGAKTVVGFIGGFLPWHGIEMLVDLAFDLRRKARNICFLLVGPMNHFSFSDPSIQQRLETIRDEGILLFVGPVPHQEVPKYIAAMDIATMPNSNDYGSPIKIFEYMASGKAVIAPRLPSIEEIITHGQNGWLVTPRNGESLRDAIEYLGGHPVLRRQLGVAARDTVAQRYTWSKIAEQVEFVLKSVVGT